MAPMSVSAAFGLPAKTQTQAEDSYVFKSGAVEIKMGEEAKTVLAQLGAPVKPVFEIDSCAYQGKDKVYSYKDFEVSTYPKNGKECISAVVVTGASVATPEGIKIGSRAADVTKAYGASDGKYGALDVRTFFFVLPEYDDVDWEPDEDVIFHKDGVAGYIIEETGEFVPKEQFEEDDKYAEAYVYNTNINI